jgi:WD40 repeat protein
VWQVRTLAGHFFEVLSVAFSPDGKSVVSGAGDRLAQIWHAETGDEVSSFVGFYYRWRGVGGVMGCLRASFVSDGS